MTMFNQLLSMGNNQPLHNNATHNSYLANNNLDNSYRSPYSVLGKSVFDKNPGPVANVGNYAPYGDLSKSLGTSGWKSSKARDDFTSNPYGNRLDEHGGDVNLGLYAMNKGWNLANPNDWKKLWNDVSQYRSGFNPTGKTGSPFPRDVWTEGTGGIHAMVRHMPRDMARAYRQSRYGGYDNGLQSPIGAPAESRSVLTGLKQNPEWDEVTGGRHDDYYG